MICLKSIRISDDKKSVGFTQIEFFLSFFLKSRKPSQYIFFNFPV